MDLFDLPISELYAEYLLRESWLCAGGAGAVACILFLIGFLAVQAIDEDDDAKIWLRFQAIGAIICGLFALTSFAISHLYPSRTTLEAAIVYRISSSPKLEKQQKLELIQQFQTIWHRDSGK